MINFNPTINTTRKIAQELVERPDSLVKKVRVTSSRLLNEEFLHVNRKEAFAKEGLSYLLPHEVWNTKKIFETIDKVGKKVDELVANKTLDKETLQKAIIDAAPETRSRIIIKDFEDLEQDLFTEKYSPEYIKKVMSNADAYNSYNEKTNKSTMYFKLEEISDKFDEISLKDDIEHELEHALNGCFTNTPKVNAYNNNFKCYKQDSKFNQIFSYFENNYQINNFMSGVDKTEENMLKKLKKSSIKELYSDFEEKLTKAIKKETPLDRNLLDTTKQWKYFYSFMKNGMKDEQRAYKSLINYRKLFADSNKPTNLELYDLSYGEMAKFFHGKKLSLFDGMHKSRGKIDTKA